MFAMADKRSFEDRFFDQLEDQFRDLKNRITDNTVTTEKILKQAQKTNGRVTKAESDISDIRRTLGKKRVELPTVDSRVLSLIAIAAIIVLVIIAVKAGAGDEVKDILS